jgi:hypothetical protein
MRGIRHILPMSIKDFSHHLKYKEEKNGKPTTDINQQIQSRIAARQNEGRGERRNYGQIRFGRN